MPQEDMTKRMGGSSSPIVDRVIDNSKNVQQPVDAPGNMKPGDQFNKTPVQPKP